MRAQAKEKLVKKMVKEGLVQEDEMKNLLEKARQQKKSVFSLMMEEEILKEEVVIDFLCEEMAIPTLALNSLRIPKDLIQLIPKKLIDRYQIIPLGRIGNSITIATSDPFELMLRDDLRGVTKCDACLVLVPPKAIASAIENYYGESSNLEEILGDIDDENLEVMKESEGEEGSGKQTRSAADEAPIVRMVNVILNEALKCRASDIHFEPYEKNFRVRYRVDGALKESYSYSKDFYSAIVARMKIMTQLDITEKRIPQDGRFRAKIQGNEIDFRVSILPIYHGEKMVLRVLDKSGMRAGLDNLGFTEKPTEVFKRAVKQPYGMILVTGPTGSGKSTTLYSILNSLNSIDRNIMTVEDPVEYQVEGITQTQVRSEIGLTFSSGLRSLLRQSPDVILVGEMRDTETADIGVKAALTGHLVFSTLHTNSAAGAMTRLIDMGVEPFLIASSVICVAAQRLLRRMCRFCKEEYMVPEETLRRCGLKKADLEGVKTYRGKGCAKCNQTGYFGRLGAIEVLEMDPEIHDLVIRRASSDDVQRKAIENGMETLFENALGLFKSGLTTLDEVLRVTSHG